MQRVSWILAAGFFLPAAIYAQNCPPVNFLQGSQVTVLDKTNSTAAGLQRQTDGSFTRQRYSIRSPYKKIDSTANYQSAFLDCSAAGNRTFRTPAGWAPLADLTGLAAQPMLLSDFLGDGTLVGLAVIESGFTSRGGPSLDSLVILVFNADGSIKSTAYYAVPTDPESLLVADLNHDGKKDVVVVSSGSGSDPGTVSVFLGRGDGTLQSAVRYPAHTNPVSALAFDFNGDRNLDLAVVNSGSNDVSILLGRGDGTFSAPVNFAVASGASSIAAGDFNGDGRADLVAGGSKNLSMLLGNGDGTFRAATNLSLSISPTSLAVGDFNRDNRLDLTAADSLGSTVSIFLGDGTGKFSAEYDYVAGYEPGGIFATDLDGDGNLDVVIATGHPDVLLENPDADYVMAFFGRGDGTLIGPPTYKTGTQLRAVGLADFNGDGKPDVAVAAGDLWILLSNGGGSFRTPVRITLPSSNGGTASANSLAAADLNGDGKQDLVLGSGYSDEVYVLLGNGDGTFQAPVRYHAAGSTNSLALADFNRDGKLDIAVCGSGYSSAGFLIGNAGIFLGNGNGTFQSVKSLSNFGNGPYSLAVGDFNKDGKLDLAIANEGDLGATPPDPGSVLVFLGQGDGTFQNPSSYAAGANPNFVTAADVNGDNVLDLLVTTTVSVQTFTYEIAVLPGNGNGTFGAATMFATSYGPHWIAVSDLNGDGKPDLAIAHCCGATDTTFKLGNGDGTFQSDIHLAASVSPYSLVVTDLNGDGKPDLIIGLGQLPSSSVSIFLNIASTSSPLTNVNGASFLAGPLAPDSWATAYGTGLATVSQGAAAANQTNIGGTTVAVRDASGAQLPAVLSYVSPTQVNYLVPHGAALGQATVTITAGNGATSSGSITIAAIGPGLFLSRPTNLISGDLIRVRADNSQSVENVYALNASGGVVPAPIDLGPPTDQVFLELFATGLRGHSAAPNSVTVTAGGISLPVTYAAAQPQYVGLDQIDVLLPQSLAGKGDVTIQVTVDGQAANTGHVTIK